ncbi:MAG TPA: hypothetical protein VMW56_25725 [Candidatus Margulisiibacteriota bacterium]|nr:hypothetical protein [Candidatus Margulisiibacteriota bacterium]
MGTSSCRFRLIPSALSLLLPLLLAVAASAAPPAVLIVSPQGAAGGWVDLDYLRELHAAGFEVDYTNGMADVSWERIKQYNVLVIFSCPPDQGVDGWPFHGDQPIYKQDFIALINRFLEEGGGVFLMAVETQVRLTLTRPLILPWGADLPLETISDAGNTAYMSRMPKTPLTFTDQILSSPVSDGVTGLWYPSQPHYNGADTLPLAVDNHWQVVVRAMPNARTVPVDPMHSPFPLPPNPLVRPGGVTAPPLFAIRQFGAGRIALSSQWPTYSIGSGTKWLYDREVLSKGLQGTPSDYGRLIENSFRWLAAPSLSSNRLGGYVTAPARLQPPNLSPEVKQQFAEPVWGGVDDRLLQPPNNTRLFKGVIGVQTNLSGGHGTVADYAAAAKQAGLDFVVFLEDFVNLDAGKLAQLKADCQDNSDGSLILYPGYHIDNNIGNHMFLFGPGLTLPPPRLLTGLNGKLFMLQGESAPGVFGATPPAAMDFLVNLTRDTQIGYYDFAHSGMGMRLQDARLYAMAALRTYRNGQLLDDVTTDYLTSAQGTISPAPVAVNFIASPSALRAAVAANQGLTYAMAHSSDTLWNDAIGYANQYSCPNVFASDGPLILRWPDCVRVSTYGAEPFVTGRGLMEAPIYITSDKGLAEVRIYDGQNLYRRFKLAGDPVFRKLLHLEGTVQRNLVLVAEDVAGGRAVSAARRAWKDGSLAPVFCGDRINDCAYMFLARGPYPMTVIRTPELSDPGATWDGGPRGILTPIDFEGCNPNVDADRGRVNGDQYNQTPLLEFADEGAVAVRSVRDELIDKRVRVTNPWNTYGPRASSRVMDFALSYTQFDRANVGVPAVGWAAPPSQTGCNAALFRSTVTFKDTTRIGGLRLLRNWNWIPGLALNLVVGRGQKILNEMSIPDMKAARASTGDAAASFKLGHGAWFGIYGPQTGNSQLFVNQGRSMELRVGQQQSGDWLSLWAPSVSQAAAGDTYTYDLFSAACPLDAAARSAQAFVDAWRYLSRPDGLRVSRGKRVRGRGPLELRAEGGAVHLSVPRPRTPTTLTLPVIVNGLNRRWSVGLWQLSGYVRGDYGGGTNRYRAVGVDLAGRAYIPLYPDLAAQTEVEIGHPVIADSHGKDLFIQVTALRGGTERNPAYLWYVDVNNPLDTPISTTLKRNMDLPNFAFASETITLAPGEHRVVYDGSAGS